MDVNFIADLALSAALAGENAKVDLPIDWPRPHGFPFPAIRPKVGDADALPTDLLNKTAKFDLNDPEVDVVVRQNEAGDRLEIEITGIPKEHAVFSTLPAKKPILDALKAGRAVPGAKLGFRLTVR